MKEACFNEKVSRKNREVVRPPVLKHLPRTGINKRKGSKKYILRRATATKYMNENKGVRHIERKKIGNMF